LDMVVNFIPDIHYYSLPGVIVQVIFDIKGQAVHQSYADQRQRDFDRHLESRCGIIIHKALVKERFQEVHRGSPAGGNDKHKESGDKQPFCVRFCERKDPEVCVHLFFNPALFIPGRRNTFYAFHLTGFF